MEPSGLRPPQNSPAARPARGRIAGIDFGTVRIGVAVADVRYPIATPYANYNRRTPELDGRFFADLARREDIQLFVVGLPVHLSGQESPKSHQARQFGDWLHAATGVPVAYFDERFTSVEAEQHLAAAQLTKKQRKARLDKLAAQILLSAWLEATASGQSTPGDLASPQGLAD